MKAGELRKDDEVLWFDSKVMRMARHKVTRDPESNGRGSHYVRLACQESNSQAFFRWIADDTEVTTP